jgi:hypothetical protein
MFFNSSVLADGGFAPYDMKLSGKLPAGIDYELGPNIILFHGTPTESGTFQTDVTVTDASGAVATHPYTLLVHPSPFAAPPPAVVPVSEVLHTTDTVKVFFPAVINVSESMHTADTIFDLGSARVLLTEILHTTDTVSVFFPAVINVSEPLHTTDTIAVVTKIGITPTTAPAGSYNVGYSQNFTAVGNTGAVTLTTSGTLPTGMSFSGSGGSRNLSGIPSQTGTFPFTIKAQDTANTTIVNYSLVINKGTQNINFPQPTSPVTYTTGLSTTLTATSSQGLGYPVTYSVSGPATVSGSTLSYTGPGTVVVTANQAGDANIAAATPVQVTIVVNAKTPSVFLANSNSTVSSVTSTLTAQSPAASGGGTGVAVDATGYVWSLTSAGSGLTRFKDVGTFSNSYTPAGVSGAKALAFDGNSSLWISNANGTLTEVSPAGTALSTAHNNTGSASSSVAIDISGNIWLTNPTASTVDEIIGGAAPTQPLSTAVTNDTPATKP